MIPLAVVLAVGLALSVATGSAPAHSPGAAERDAASDATAATPSTTQVTGTGRPEATATPIAFEQLTLRHSHPEQALSLRFAGTTTATVRLGDGRRARTLTPRIAATTDWQVKPMPGTMGSHRVGFSIAGLTFSYRDQEHSLSFAVGAGRGPKDDAGNRADGMSTMIDGQRGRSIAELDIGGGPTELPPTLNEILATAQLHPTAGVRGIATRLPSTPTPAPGREATDNPSLQTYQDPAALAALYYIPLPDAPLAELQNANGQATWTATLPFPSAHGQPARDLEFRYTTTTATTQANDPLQITFNATPGQLPQGHTIQGSLELDPTNERPHTITYTLTKSTEQNRSQTTWHLSPTP